MTRQKQALHVVVDQDRPVHSMTASHIPPALRRFKPPLTKADIATMTEHELAALATLAPAGLTAVFDASGQFSFTDLDGLSPAQRADLTIIGGSR